MDLGDSDEIIEETDDLVENNESENEPENEEKLEDPQGDVEVDASEPGGE